ncbi:conserved hypothetical protein [Theileria equi strain WA]|uniref:SAC3/GANP/THP3 conserved domain-containing protein n=1 Tax=Theileria equi strain WA TaxID=1537102 RepID=L1LDH7_THEEQ|nr:conserved hypothetical protein [Theileria equi strain WA]EKX73319.1 conserved hypothetical protein [Theileria equi strain WA]|eukprot:XP_004832771.1 conserved hypothetical protein [Theileria equi strain WA]
MQNQNTFGAPGQPVRASYNMLFSHFKNLGYSDEIAKAEADRIMRQTTAQQVPMKAPIIQQPNPYGYMPQMMPVPQFPVVQAPVVQNPPLMGAMYNKDNLLSGVKLSSKAPFMGWSVPVSSEQKMQNVIPIKLKTGQPDTEKKVRAKGFHDPISPSVMPQPQLSPPKMTPIQPVFPPMPQQMYPGAIPTQVSHAPPVAQSMQSNAKMTQDIPKITIDVPKKTSTEKFDQWVKKLHDHFNVGTSTKKFKKTVRKYVDKISEDVKSGKIDVNDLKIPALEDILRGAEPAPKPLSPQLVPKNAPKPKPALIEKPKPPADKPKPPVEKPKYLPIGAQFHGFPSPYVSSDELQRREQRSQRFKRSIPGGIYNFNPERGKAIIGTSEELEKPYLRLTAEPNPRMVRPEHVLKESFKYVFDRFMMSKNYRYIEEQFRSIRQDIQVQHIRSPFVVRLYSTNARIALLHGDLDQFNQCQTQLIHLHKQGDLCTVSFSFFDVSLQVEFEFYRLLYLALQNMKMDTLRNLRNIYHDTQFKSTVYYEYANEIRLSISEDNFVKYFALADTKNLDFDHYLNRIYNEAFNDFVYKEDVSKGPPFYSKFLFKMFEPRFRMLSLVTLCKTSLSIAVETLINILNFENKESCITFLKESRVIFNENGLLDCKKTLPVILESPLLRSKKI